MKSKISLFNFSLNDLFEDQEDSFLKAKHKILFTVFILTFIKGTIAISVAAYFDQYIQFVRGLAYVFVYIILFYCFLKKIIPFRPITHTIIVVGLVLVYTNLFLTAKSVNLITVQFVFTIILSSFYILNSRFGIFYSLLVTIPVLVSLALGYDFSSTGGLGALASPGYEIIVFINFITIIYIPYLFYESFVKTLSEKEDLNIQLKIAIQKANDGANVKSNFLSTMSHELRTPLNTVIGTTDLLLADRYEPHQAENLRDLKFSANTLLNIINDILDYNKLESSKLSLETINVDLSKLLRTACSGLHFQAADKHIDLKLEIDEEIDNYDVLTDPTRITQIVYNLVGNAIKFTSVGEVVLKLEILKKQADKITIRFLIKDSGIGISKDKQSVIFEPFSQASNSITRGFGGTGLGLSIVKQLLTLFKSQINLQSEMQQGSTFWFDIAFKYHPKLEKVTTRPSLEIIVDKDISDLKILVAEDNLMNRVLVKKVFSKWKNEPAFAENGQQAIEMASERKFDIILMDLHMPLVDGYLASKTIKNDKESVNKDTVIIAFTASISKEILAEVNACGMADYIYKPFDANEMYHKIRGFYPLK
ncbi:ATP-binding protein [Pedobacter arcticus]|uniref:ATP-binding protein n=1 Tax=Pedobacter arcticus TaxID=752140 RepID=UPI0002EFD273|nr:ATP-binding protein [Pedobacter arcticus]